MLSLDDKKLATLLSDTKDRSLTGNDASGIWNLYIASWMTESDGNLLTITKLGSAGPYLNWKMAWCFRFWYTLMTLTRIGSHTLFLQWAWWKLFLPGQQKLHRLPLCLNGSVGVRIQWRFVAFAWYQRLKPSIPSCLLVLDQQIG